MKYIGLLQYHREVMNFDRIYNKYASTIEENYDLTQEIKEYKQKV